MLKAKQYDWKDSNLALFGSDTEKKVKNESAETEKAWKDTQLGDENATVVFRINKFKVEAWPKDQYGEFYNGDSYIVYHQEKDKESDVIKKDVHFWIGKYSTQDEYGTAAYKTVELDTLHDDVPIQHREVQGHESSKFKSYFPEMTLLKGGCDTGFIRVLPEQYVPRLFHVQKQGRRILCTEIAKKRGNLTSDDVFIIDLGLKVYQYNGSKCSHDEKFKAGQETQKLKASRNKKISVESLEENETGPDHPALKILQDGKSKSKEDLPKAEPKMFRVSDADGSLDMEEGQAPNLEKLKEMKDDVVIVIFGDHAFCWVGSGASVDERRNALAYASNHVNKLETPWLPITVVADGKENDEFLQSF